MNNSITDIKGKPFFMLWSVSDIAYDSLLGISLTLNTTDITSVYLNKYSKKGNKLSMVFTFTRLSGEAKEDVLAHVNATLTQGIQTIDLTPSEYLLSGNVTVIDSTRDEFTELPVQVSPLYVHYTNISKEPCVIKVNGTSVDLANTEIIFDSTVADTLFVENDNNLYLEVTVNDNFTSAIDNRQVSGITSFAGAPIKYNEDTEEWEGTLELPDNFIVKPISDNFALIRPYTYETCVTGDYIYKDLGKLVCNVSKSEDFPLPLDVCFDVTDEGYVLNPRRIDNMEAPDKVGYLTLNELH